LYASLLAQNDNDFEWVLVDDGSDDDTAVLIRSFATKAPFKVIYVFQENSGKHVAINSGVAHSSGEFILIVDSDDAMTENAILSVQKATIKATEDIAGVCFRRSYFDGQLIGNKVEGMDSISMHPSEASVFFGGDLAYAFRKKALIDNPFPVIIGEKFVPELFVWNKIGDQGKIKYFPNNSIYLCEYLPDGYSANFMVHLKKSPKGFRLFYIDQFLRGRTFIARLKCAIRAIQCLYYELAKSSKK
jgi:glycosyltransferase involved in cell wall biosynthesis